MNSKEQSRDISSYYVPVSIVVGAIVLAVSAIYGLDARIETQIEQRMGPLSGTLKEIKDQQREIAENVQELRESVAEQRGVWSGRK